MAIFSNSPKRFFGNRLLCPPLTYIFTEIPRFFVIDKRVRKNLIKIRYQNLILGNFELFKEYTLLISKNLLANNSFTAAYR